jgi:4-hydroxy-2-oxoheptanedioate aldolase
MVNQFASADLFVRNRFREKLYTGRRTTIMALRLARSVDVAKIAAAAGFDGFYIDVQHSTIGLDAATQICSAGLDLGLTPLVRVPSHDRHDIARVLDGGALGIIVPDVEDATQAFALVRHAKFAPLGHRSISTTAPQTGFETMDQQDFVEAANSETMVIAMIESRTGVENVDDIAGVAGIDAIMVGTNDLTVDMGIPGQHGHKRVTEAYQAIIAAGARHDTPVLVSGIRDLDRIAALIRMGAAPCYFSGNDIQLLLAAARDEVAAFRDADLG